MIFARPPNWKEPGVEDGAGDRLDVCHKGFGSVAVDRNSGAEAVQHGIGEAVVAVKIDRYGLSRKHAEFVPDVAVEIKVGGDRNAGELGAGDAFHAVDAEVADLAVALVVADHT